MTFVVCGLQYGKHCGLFDLARLVCITPDNFPTDKKDRPRFPQKIVIAFVDLMQIDNKEGQ